MGKSDYELVRALMQQNPDMRVLAVGDDDQNIFAFRGSSANNLRRLADLKGAVTYELTANYRSAPAIVAFANAFAETLERRLKKESVTAVRNVRGTVSITEYTHKNIEENLIRQIINNRSSNGTCCVLTQTNEEASVLTGLLTHHGCRARLIQSDDAIKLRNLAEMRYFLRQLQGTEATPDPIISREAWKSACDKLSERYAESDCLETCLNLLHMFETTYPHETFFNRTDFETFLHESNYEDARPSTEHAITVSTIHKAKGLEFDSVYLLLMNCGDLSEEKKRTIYVALTRAKNNLFIHCNTPLFEGLKKQATTYQCETANFPPPQTLTLNLTHRDVVLDFFKENKRTILSLRSGKALTVRSPFLLATTSTGITPVVKLSHAFCERIATLQQQNFKPTAATINFILAWKAKEDKEETAVLLPSVTFTRP